MLTQNLFWPLIFYPLNISAKNERLFSCYVDVISMPFILTPDTCWKELSIFTEDIATHLLWVFVKTFNLKRLITTKKVRWMQGFLWRLHRVDIDSSKYLRISSSDCEGNFFLSWINLHLLFLDWNTKAKKNGWNFIENGNWKLNRSPFRHERRMWWSVFFKSKQHIKIEFHAFDLFRFSV